jgi:hypothetical protein
MKRKLLYFGFFLAVFSLSGCVKDEPITLESLEVWPSDKFVTQIHFVSKLTNAAIGATEADYAQVSNYFTATLNSTQGSWLGIIDRSDVIYHPTDQQNSALKCALDSKHWTYLAMNKVTGGNRFEASTLFLNSPVIGSTTYKAANDCYITGPILNMEGKRDDGTKISFDVYFRTARFDTPAQIEAFGGGENGIMFSMKRERMNFLMVGTVKKDLIDTFHTTITNTDNEFKLHIVEGTETNDYAIFILGEEHFWGYAGSTVTSLSNGINAYSINLNW